jgi:hypothetical protein
MIRHPGRAYPQKEPLAGAQALSATNIILIAQEVVDLYSYLVRHGLVSQSPFMLHCYFQGEVGIEETCWPAHGAASRHNG